MIQDIDYIFNADLAANFFLFERLRMGYSVLPTGELIEENNYPYTLEEREQMRSEELQRRINNLNK